MSDIDTSAEKIASVVDRLKSWKLRMWNTGWLHLAEDAGGDAQLIQTLAAENERLRRERDGAWNAALDKAANWLDEMRVSSRSRAIDGIRALKTPEADT